MFKDRSPKYFSTVKQNRRHARSLLAYELAVCKARVLYMERCSSRTLVFLPHLYLRGCSCCYCLVSWVSLSGHKLHKDPKAAKLFSSCPEPWADVFIPLGFFITCSIYKIALASLPTLTSGEWKAKLPTCSTLSKHEFSNCRWDNGDNGDNNPISVLNPSWSCNIIQEQCE